MKFEQIMQELQRKVYQPIYFLCGEEEFFIDQIADFIESNVLDEAEKEFNQTVVYGRDVEIMELESTVKRYPMMASYNVVIVKEAQYLKKWDQLLSYIESPSDSSILVICHKHKKPDGRNAGVKALKKHAVYFESKKLYENQVAQWIEHRVSATAYSIHPKAVQLLIEFLGTDLGKISNEIDKLTINLKSGETIDAKIIEQNIGISKDYNVFELNNALGSKDLLKANRIAQHFGKNESAFPVPMILPTLYRFFAQLLLFKSLPAGNPKVAASKLGINPYFIKDYQKAAQHYSQKKIAKIMASLRKADIRSKGVGVDKLSNDQLLQELVYEILH